MADMKKMKIDFWKNYDGKGDDIPPLRVNVIKHSFHYSTWEYTGLEMVRIEAYANACGIDLKTTPIDAEFMNAMEEWYLNLAESAIPKKEIVTEIPEETTVVIQNGRDEWWMEPSHCQKCENEFMASNAKYCPYCGRKIIGVSNGKRTIYNFNEEEEKLKDHE